MGTLVEIAFDQNTNQAQMTMADDNCSRVLAEETVSQLSLNVQDARCLWSSRDSLLVFLGMGASILPGDIFVIRPISPLKTWNEVSGISEIQSNGFNQIKKMILLR